MKTNRGALLILLLVASTALMAAGVVFHRSLPLSFKIWFSVIWIVAATGGGLLYSMRGRLWPGWTEELREHAREIDQLESRRARLIIALVVACGLFAELMLIRWHSSTFQVFGYFKNLSLLACFLGLGAGYALDRKKPIFASLSVPAIALQFVVFHLLRFSPLQFALNNPVNERLTQGLPTVRVLPDRLLVYGFLLTVFLVTALAMLPLGQLAGRCMAARGKLSAYGWNLAGSLAGTVAFTICAFFWLTPESWLLLGLAPLLFVLRGRWTVMWGLGSLVLATSVLTWPIDPLERDVYSPYQRITYRNTPYGGIVLKVNDFFFQHALDLRKAAIGNNPRLQLEATLYEMPHRVVPGARGVLILGSGAGNDVAAAIRRGAGGIEAVEIDPVILEYGLSIHPERPYSHPQVTVYNTDARNFVRESRSSYDLVIYGWLDSHTTASALSSTRLDSYVFTVQSFAETRERLSDRGVMYLGFSIMAEEQVKKMYDMLATAFDGTPPRVFFVRNYGRTVFLAGPGLEGASIPPFLKRSEVTGRIATLPYQVDQSTDDWPFMYMPSRTYPLSYLALNVLLLVGGLIFVYATVGGIRGTWIDPTFFFLGAGFMLVEAKAITELSLIFGSTWLVASVAIFFVLVMAGLANILAMKKLAPSPSVSAVALLLSLGAGAFLSDYLVGVLSASVAKIVVPALLTLPIFFAGLVFSSFLAERGSIPSAMASNLLGALLGGLLEYNALFLGYKSLYFLALGIYLVAALFILRSRDSAA
jgi:spermidine synthase